jgi:hypothetical protein
VHVTQPALQRAGPGGGWLHDDLVSIMHTQTLLDSVGQLLQVRCLYVLTISSPCAHPAALPRDT